IRRHADDRKRRRWQWDGDGAIVLGPLFGQGPRPSAKIKLAESHAADFLTPTAGQDQQSDDATIIIITASTPDRDQLGIVENSLARASLDGLTGADNWIAFDQAFLHCPRKKCGERGAGTSYSSRAALV